MNRNKKKKNGGGAVVEKEGLTELVLLNVGCDNLETKQIYITDIKVTFKVFKLSINNVYDSVR